MSSWRLEFVLQDILFRSTLLSTTSRGLKGVKMVYFKMNSPDKSSKNLEVSKMIEMNFFKPQNVSL